MVVLLALFVLALYACTAASKDLPQNTIDTYKIYYSQPVLTLTYENKETEPRGASPEWKYPDEKSGL